MAKLGQEKQDGYFKFWFSFTFPRIGVKNANNKHEEISKEVLNGAKERLNLLISVGLKPILAIFIGQFVMSIQGFNMHANSCKLYTTVNPNALSNGYLFLPFVVEGRVEGRYRVFAIHVVELLIWIRYIVVNVLDIDFGIELYGDIVGEMLKLFYEDRH